VKWLVAACALLLCGLVGADRATEDEIKSLESQLNLLQQEQQSVYQQFQMIQELRRTELQAQNPQVIQNSPAYAGGSPPNYEDVVREKAERDYRINQYTEELNSLYAKYREIEDQKRLVLERLHALMQQR